LELRGPEKDRVASGTGTVFDTVEIGCSSSPIVSIVDATPISAVVVVIGLSISRMAASPL
jgi:hypothetical protein